VIVNAVGSEARRNFANRGNAVSPFNNIVKRKTENIPETITGMPRLPSNPKACPVDLALGRVSV
jgi:hypothetical protein